MTYPVVKDLARDGIPVKLSCRVIGFSRQAYYQWLAEPVSAREWSDAYGANADFDAHADDPEFGYRFLADELRGRGLDVSDHQTLKACRLVRVRCCHSIRRGSGKRPGPAVHDDLVRRQFRADRPNQLWLTDISEHWAGDLQALPLRGQGHVLEPDRGLLNRPANEFEAGRGRPADGSVPARRQSRSSGLPGAFGSRVAISGQTIRGDAAGQRLGWVDGPGRCCWGQRGDGILLRAVAEERAETASLVVLRPAPAPDRELDRADLSPPSQTGPSREPRVEFEMVQSVQAAAAA